MTPRNHANERIQHSQHGERFKSRIRNKTGEIIKGLEELKQNITIVTETKKKGNGVELLVP